MPLDGAAQDSAAPGAPPSPADAADNGQEISWCVEENGVPHAQHDFIPARGVAPAHRQTVETLLYAGALRLKLDT
jgi:hypothetical protein